VISYDFYLLFSRGATHISLHPVPSYLITYQWGEKKYTYTPSKYIHLFDFFLYVNIEIKFGNLNIILLTLYWW